MNKETSRRNFLAAAMFGGIGCVTVMKGRPVAGNALAERLKNMKPSDVIAMGKGGDVDDTRRRYLKERKTDSKKKRNEKASNPSHQKGLA